MIPPQIFSTNIHALIYNVSYANFYSQTRWHKIEILLIE